MEASFTLLVYNDARRFGGHERMTVRVIEELTRYVRVVFVYNSILRSDYRFKSYNPNLKLVPTDFYSRRLQLLYNYLLPKLYVNFLRDVIRDNNINTVLVSQGNIELSSSAVIVCKDLGVKVVSYIPIILSPRTRVPYQMLKDLLRWRIYNSIDEFLLCDDSLLAPLEEWLRRRVKISIIPNFYSEETQVENYRYNDDFDGVQVVLPGRIEFKHKGQLDFLKSFRKLEIPWIKIYIVGDGSDFEFLQNWISRKGMNHRVELRPWSSFNGLDSFDIVLFTSHYEGMPLLFLEAMVKRKFIVANKIPVFENYLYDKVLFNVNDSDSIRKVFESFIEFKDAPYRCYKYERDFSKSQFDQSIYNWIGKILEK